MEALDFVDKQRHHFMIKATAIDIFPLIEKNAPETVSPKLVKMYHIMESADLLHSVSAEEKKRKLMARGEGQLRGRPRKEAE